MRTIQEAMSRFKPGDRVWIKNPPGERLTGPVFDLLQRISSSTWEFCLSRSEARSDPSWRIWWESAAGFAPLVHNLFVGLLSRKRREAMRVHRPIDWTGLGVTPQEQEWIAAREFHRNAMGFRCARVCAEFPACRCSGKRPERLPITDEQRAKLKKWFPETARSKNG